MNTQITQNTQTVKMTRNQSQYLKKLEKLLGKKNNQIVTQLIATGIKEWNSDTNRRYHYTRGATPPKYRSRWHWLKQLSGQLYQELHGVNVKKLSYYQQIYYLSAIRAIILNALIQAHSAWKTAVVTQLRTQVVAEQLIPRLWQKKTAKKNRKMAPLALIMGAKYVIARSGNSQVLTQLLREKGSFPLIFRYPQQRSTITASLKAHSLIRNYLQAGAEVKLVNIWTSGKPACKVRAKLVSNRTIISISKYQTN